VKTILVVDDEPQIAGIVRDYLRLAGFDVIVAGDGVHALEAARGRRPDLVVLDLQVLLNLLANALRHTPVEGTVSVEVEVLQRQILVRVRDSGSGIAPEDLPRIFERFQKGSDSRGSGLGLAIARKLVLAHGGDIGIQSAPGQGTEVTVSLPR
jgi:signal transduction histidine kinase